MKLQTTNLEINESVRQHIDQKLSQIDRHLPGISSVVVELASEPTRSQQDRIVALATLKIGRSIMRAPQIPRELSVLLLTEGSTPLARCAYFFLPSLMPPTQLGHPA